VPFTICYYVDTDIRKMKNDFKISGGISERKRPTERSRCGRKDDLILILWKFTEPILDFIRLTQNRNEWRSLLNIVMDVSVP
jgi:hypothetical protein